MDGRRENGTGGGGMVGCGKVWLNMNVVVVVVSDTVYGWWSVVVQMGVG